ncbi:hypothetical protein A3D84_02890 [Candidatus Woesebacteria bacterium RIFCSPHIGHO2_02_FULL_42_20]|uniref:DUF2283 domain-containing protein n=1 Tax=Candidatus Woesebacteria bacterium RIFCSPHIGHO2_12_FULL_41_24 TaxID=1802510 RepID=A0A1F8AS10_9BACT|nr:MAG: hypothetical protein A2W15_03075 [Candidatus Woesebacteria bacterium RBG_16_41_13]OGM29082.1 MAG: hypothetical protein A2873_01925 [Candidatus Woesebacteria bacterium RIFCSPHIGHO2_01_FULL_42_80]OGM34790.1 MAG: hypothetical protein A3D84_02890 [Candidatus Woesebacteria bacterium RIFCSPHIGHO2_02_FULL_42_20]OGM54557.1 MAG: hypothetical protein A3E44_06110 [Candidatus Woesebacteria bacterium RIFCSPHIGHO2_12_FULL_41_24]OGM66736.1 MAG: hypothetical protein A2969_05215 [Candidatus Woesebacteri
MKAKKTKSGYPEFVYEKEDDVLNIWLSKRKIDYAEQSGDVIIHFTKNSEPVYIEVLDASKFLRVQSRALPKDLRETLFVA